MAPTKKQTLSSLSPFKSVSLLNALVLVMATYIIIDLGMHFSRSEHGHVQSQVATGLSESFTSGVGDGRLWLSGVDNSESCNSIEAHIDVLEGQQRKPHDPWSQLKIGLPPARCPVKGYLIERLDPLTNFRRGVALRFTDDLDDRTFLDPWFLGSKVDLNKAKRRVYIDFGANYFGTSVLFFNERYPVDFTEIYAFETDPNLFKMPAGWDEDENEMDPNVHQWQKIKSREGVVPTWLLERIHFFNKYAGTEDSESSMNVTRWMKEELNLRPDDTVIVKMDIEGAEWPILDLWLKDWHMPLIIDELFVELHYWHPDNNWESFNAYKREDATRMLAELRYKGFYAHYWD